MNDYIGKVDVSEPGLFVMKLNQHSPTTRVKHIGDHIKEKLNNYAPGSDLVIIGPEFDPIVVPDEETMNRLGWHKIVEDPVGQLMPAPNVRYFIVEAEGFNHRVMFQQASTKAPIVHNSGMGSENIPKQHRYILDSIINHISQGTPINSPSWITIWEDIK